jgi:hypothetical protein
MRLLRTTARRAAREEGLTVVEVVVAGLILTIGGLGVLGMVDVSTRNTFRAEQSQLLNNVLQREMEEIRELPYEDVGLTTLPANEAGANNPNSRVVGTAFYAKRNGTELKPMISGGAVVSGPESFQVEDVKGTIYRYVVWDNCREGLCTEADYLKRAIVVAKLDSTASGGADRRYREIQAQIVDPEAVPDENPGPAPGGGTIAPWPLWLTDTTCINSSRLEIEGDHLAHNTRGICAGGLKTGNEPGAPDLLWPEAPPLTGESPVYDYALDVEPEASPDHDKGLQVMKGSDCGEMPATTIATTPDVDEEMFKRLHKWVTPEVPAATTDLALTGNGKLSLWTQSIEGAVYFGRICIWVFVREGGKDTALVRPLESLPYTAYSESAWPSSGWTEITVPLDLQAPGGGGGEIALPPGAQIGLALSVDNDAASGVQILYDEPSFDSRLVLETTGTLPEWPAS